MKNFLSQTWVVSVVVLIVLAVVIGISYKLNHKESEDYTSK